MPNNMFGQFGGQPGMGQPQQGQAQGSPPQGRQAMPSNPWMSQLGGGGTPLPGGGWSIGGGGPSQPDDSFIRQSEQALMQAQASGAPPSQIAQMQMNLQNAQRDYQQAMSEYQQGQRGQYLQGIQGASQPIGAGSIGGWGNTSGPTSQLQQDPMLGQLLQNQFGQGFSSGGGPRS